MSRSHGSLLAVVILVVLGLFAAFATSARAVVCDTNWTGGDANGDWFSSTNWDNGVPGPLTDACIAGPTATVKIAGAAAQTKSLSLSGGTIEIAGTFDGAAFHSSSLTLEDGGTISSDSTVELTTECTGQNCVGGGTPALYNMGATPLTNAGTITAAAGTGGNTRELAGNISNTGMIDVATDATYGNGISNTTLDNKGTISIENALGALLTLSQNETSTVINDTGGSITNNGGPGSMIVRGSDTFTQAAGTTSPSSPNPAHPAVIVDGGNVTYTGTGASTILTKDSVVLSGNLASGQNLVVDGIDPVPACNDGTLTSPTSFTNAGTITETGDCNTSLTVTSGGITNTGTLVMDPTAQNKTHEISGSLVNSGTVTINGATAFDGSSATLTQTAGKTTIAPGVILDASGSGASFELEGGVLTGGGHDQASEAIFNGPVDNTGGNVIPGSTTTPGLMTFDGTYTQSAPGKLTIVIDGAGGQSGVGTHYSQLGAIGSIGLGGTLAISTLTNPSVGDQDTILGSAGSIIGSFSSLTGQFLPARPFPPGWTFGYHTVSGANSLALSADAAAGLRVRKAGPGTGTVTSSPAGISCGSSCLAPFFSTQTVTLTEHPGAGWAFNGWSGACSGFTTTCHVAMSQARTVTATFAHGTTTTLRSSANPSKVGRKVTYTATVSPHPSGGTVRFTSGGSPISGCGAKAVNASTGKATCAVKYRSKGTRRIQAAYSGNPSFVPSTSSVLTETIRKR